MSSNFAFCLSMRVYDDNFRYAAFGGVIPNAFGTYADAVLRVNDDKRNVRYAQRRERLAHEIEVARRIHDVEFFLHPRRVEQRGLRRDLPLPFAYVVVRDGRAVGDTPHAADSAATGQHGLAEQRLAGRCVPDNGKVADVRGRMRCHNPQDEAEMAHVQGAQLDWRRALPNSGASTRPCIRWTFPFRTVDSAACGPGIRP